MHITDILGFLFLLLWNQGPHYKEFVKAATADNAIQFVEVSNIDVANVLFPNVKQVNLFLGIVKSEAERYTAYGELANRNLYLSALFTDFRCALHFVVIFFCCSVIILYF